MEGLGRIRRLDGGEPGLQGDGEHRVVAQLVESVVVVSELLNQHLPARWVQQILTHKCEFTSS